MEKSEYNKSIVEIWTKRVDENDALIMCMIGFKEDGVVEIQSDGRLSPDLLANSLEITAKLLREKHKTTN